MRNWSSAWGITAWRDNVRHLIWIDAISLSDLFGPDAREFPARRRVKDCCGWRGELKGISIAASDYGSAACGLLSGDCGGEKVVRLEPRGFGVCEPKGGDKIWLDISCSINSSSNTRPL